MKGGERKHEDKKIVPFLLLIIGITLKVYKVNALTIQENTVTTNTGYIMSKEDYETLSQKYSDLIIDNTPGKELKILTSKNTTLLNSEKKYIVTDYFTDSLGNILLSTDKEVSEIIAKNILNNNDITTYGNSGNTFHQTASKVIVIDTYYTGSEYFTTLTADWYTTPKIKSYDIMAIRWTNGNINVTDATGIQVYAYQNSINYSFNGNNMVNKSNGIGISMNLVDDGSDYALALYVHSKKNGNTYYGSYQHAIKTLTLAQSKNYTFSNSGLGGVILFSTTSTESYYDNMQGVTITS